jgi:hypothetical protein
MAMHDSRIAIATQIDRRMISANIIGNAAQQRTGVRKSDPCAIRAL